MAVNAGKYCLATLLMMSVFATAQAAWQEASSANFVVYADDSEKNMRRLSEQLELYHQAMERIIGVDLPEPSPSNRVVVYVVRTMDDVQRLMGKGVGNIAAFYIPRAGGSISVVPRIQAQRGDTDFSMVALMHEYAHHFIMSNSQTWLPQWLNEGAAEFFASAAFPQTGGITLGMPSNFRLTEIAFAPNVTVERMLDPAAFRDGARKGFESFYGKSWALYHYLTLDAQGRRGQLSRYMRLLREGKNWRDAGVGAFGDLRILEKELQIYMQRTSFLSVRFKQGELQPGNISLRPLTRGEVAVMPVVVRSRRGVNLDQAKALLPEARKIAAMYPADPAVLAALAEAELDAREYANAIAAADGALAIDPKRVNALYQKGLALFQVARTAKDRDKAYAAAMDVFFDLNQIENDHPTPMIHYFLSFTARNMRPPDQAVKALDRAIEIAPFDSQLRQMRARFLLSGRNFAAARGDLSYLATNPHLKEVAERADQILDRLDAGGNPTPEELVALLDEQATKSDNPK
jgi:tetratricopeptide (TPR) repeat protein